MAEQKALNIAVVGICGFGADYFKTLFPLVERGKISIQGVVDIRYEDSSVYGEIRKRGIACYRSMEELYAQQEIDLTFLVTPIHLHKSQAIVAMERGSHVYCEKPIAGCLQDALEMKATAKRRGKLLAIGFQGSYANSNLGLKSDILQGVYGKPVYFKAMNLTPRPLSYFAKSWSGKRYAADGTAIMDSVAMNATAHYLHNMLFLLGKTMDKAAGIQSVDALLYRANAIETFDACKIDVRTEDGVPCRFVAAHCVENQDGPAFCLRFEKGTVQWDAKSPLPVGRLFSGEIKEYQTRQPHSALEVVIDCVRTGQFENITCDIDTALPHLMVMEQVNQGLDLAEVPDDARQVELAGKPYLVSDKVTKHLRDLYLEERAF